MGDFDIKSRDSLAAASDTTVKRPGLPPAGTQPSPTFPNGPVGNGGQPATLELSKLAQSITGPESVAARKAELLEQVKKPLLSKKAKESVLKLLQDARKDGTLPRLVQEMMRREAADQEPPLKQLYQKMGTPASQGISDMLIIALTFGSQVMDDWQKDKRQEMLAILKAGRIDPKVVEYLQPKAK